MPGRKNKKYYTYTTDVKQMIGISCEHVEVRVSETVIIYARGMSRIETGGKWFELPAEVVVN